MHATSAQMGEQLRTVKPGHVHVTDDEMHGLAFHCRDRLAGRTSRDDAKSPRSQEAVNDMDDYLLVVDNKYGPRFISYQSNDHCQVSSPARVP